VDVPAALRLGLSTENRWWGPGVRNALVLGSQGPGFGHFFIESREPWVTRAGSFEAQYLLGLLRESKFFDYDASNDQRSLSAAAVTWRPPPGLDALVPEIGLSHAVLAYRPDDFAARSFLGQVWFRGRWRLQAEVDLLRRAEEARAESTGANGASDESAIGQPAGGEPAGGARQPEVAAVDCSQAADAASRTDAGADARDTDARDTDARVARLQRALWAGSDRSAERALRELTAIATRDGRPALARLAERAYWRARLAWRQAAPATGILGVQVQHVRLLGFDTVQVGFGNGTGRLMLPRTESVSFGGYVAVPLGR
jgi:hypothetical protein